MCEFDCGKMSPHKWTIDEERKLQELYPLMPNREIAKLFGVSKIAIDHKTERMGLNESQKTYRIREVVCDYCGNILRRLCLKLRGAIIFARQNVMSNGEANMLLRFNLNYLLHSPWLTFVACF